LGSGDKKNIGWFVSMHTSGCASRPENMSIVNATSKTIGGGASIIGAYFGCPKTAWQSRGSN
jgi:hypothetical protein